MRCRLLEDELAQLSRGAGVRVVGQVPDLSACVGMLAEIGEALANVGDVGRCGADRVAEDTGGVTGQGGREEPVRLDCAPPRGPT